MTFLLFLVYFIFIGLYGYNSFSELSRIIHSNYSRRPIGAPLVPMTLEYYLEPYLSVWRRFDSVENTAYL